MCSMPDGGQKKYVRQMLFSFVSAATNLFRFGRVAFSVLATMLSIAPGTHDDGTIDRP